MKDNPLKPRRRWLSRSPNRSIIVRIGDASLRVGRRTQGAVKRLVLGKVLKVAVPLVIAAVAALVAWLEVC